MGRHRGSLELANRCSCWQRPQVPGVENIGHSASQCTAQKVCQRGVGTLEWDMVITNGTVDCLTLNILLPSLRHIRIVKRSEI
jgi:hypothetical protein